MTQDSIFLICFDVLFNKISDSFKCNFQRSWHNFRRFLTQYQRFSTEFLIFFDVIFDVFYMISTHFDAIWCFSTHYDVFWRISTQFRRFSTLLDAFRRNFDVFDAFRRISTQFLDTIFDTIFDAVPMFFDVILHISTGLRHDFRYLMLFAFFLIFSIHSFFFFFLSSFSILILPFFLLVGI